MKKPNGYDECNIERKEQPLPGGHKAIILNLEELESKNGKPMVKVSFDFDKGDSQEGLFTATYKANDKPDKKWPFAGTMWIMTETADGNTNKSFKSFMASVEKSNKGFQPNWEAADFGAQFKKKKIGIVFGEEEREYQGKIYTDSKPRWTCEYDKAEEQKIPELRALKPAAVDPEVPEGFTTLNEDDMPF